MISVEVTTDHSEIEIGKNTVLWERPYFQQELLGPNFDVASDGRFLMLKVSETSDGEPERIHVYLDWLSEV